jgi:RHS repeat-associated protein
MVRLASVLCLLYACVAFANAPLRLDIISSPAGNFGYYYNAGSTVRAGDRVTGIRLPNLASITNQFDSLGRFEHTALLNQWGHVLDGYEYAHDLLGLRANIVRDFGLGTNNVALGYDPIGQLTSWRASESSGTPRQHEQLAWVYDSAGNLRFRTNNAFVQSFITDPANQLTNVSRSGNFTAAGSLSAPTTNVTVNSQTADRYSDLTFARTNLTLSAGPTTFTNTARNAYGTATTNTLTVTLPQSVTLQYDRDGNLTNDGARSFAYDAENQLTAVYVPGQWKAEFVYDGLGRRRIMREYGANFGAPPTNEIRFVYDGMLPVQERDGANQPLVTYARGLDLSGGFQGAGGIGGLLARTDGTGSAFYHADGAGNITALLDYQQNVAARYAYGPFGNLLGKWGPLLDANTMRFSSRPLQPIAGLYDYGFRQYDPSLQRWLSQDPIAEWGGLNLYEPFFNSPLTFADRNGLDNIYNMPAGNNAVPSMSISMDVRTGEVEAGYTEGIDPLFLLGSMTGFADPNQLLSLLGPLMDLATLTSESASPDEKLEAGMMIGMNIMAKGKAPALRKIKMCRPKMRTHAENVKARNFFKNHKDEARKAWEQRTGQKWPTDANGNPWPAEHTPSLKSGADPLTVVPRDPRLPIRITFPGLTG